MAKTQSGTQGYSSRTLTVILVILCLITIGGFIVIEYVLPDKDIEYINVSGEYNKLENEVNSQREEIEKINTEIEKINSLNENIELERNEFFANASLIENKVKNGELNVKIGYLTFDDGPYYDTSPKFLDVLEQYDVLATFFYLEKGEDYLNLNYLPIFDRLIHSGHTLGNHTATHQLGSGGVYSSSERFLADIERNRQFIKDHFGITTTVMRFPGGINTSGGLRDSILNGLRNMDPPYAYAQWDAATGDGGAGSYSIEEDGVTVYTNNVLETTKDRNSTVVLMHDYSYTTLEALPRIIEGMRAQGYIFLPLFYDSLAVGR